MGAGRWEDGRGKEGEWGGAGRQHRPYSYHRQSFQSATHKTGGGYLTSSDEFCEYCIPNWKNCTFTRSEDDGTSQLLLPFLGLSPTNLTIYLNVFLKYHSTGMPYQNLINFPTIQPFYINKQ